MYAAGSPRVADEAAHGFALCSPVIELRALWHSKTYLGACTVVVHAIKAQCWLANYLGRATFWHLYRLKYALSLLGTIGLGVVALLKRTCHITSSAHKGGGIGNTLIDNDGINHTVLDGDGHSRKSHEAGATGGKVAQEALE